MRTVLALVAVVFLTNSASTAEQRKNPSVEIESKGQRTHVDYVDFFVDLKDYDRKRATIKNCYLAQSDTRSSVCYFYNNNTLLSQIIVPASALRPEDLKRAVRNCSGYAHQNPSTCNVEISGTVFAAQPAELRRASIRWAE